MPRVRIAETTARARANEVIFHRQKSPPYSNELRRGDRCWAKVGCARMQASARVPHTLRCRARAIVGYLVLSRGSPAPSVRPSSGSASSDNVKIFSVLHWTFFSGQGRASGQPKGIFWCLGYGRASSRPDVSSFGKCRVRAPARRDRAGCRAYPVTKKPGPVKLPVPAKYSVRPKRAKVTC